MNYGQPLLIQNFGEAAIRAVSESAFSEGKREQSERFARIGEAKSQLIEIALIFTKSRTRKTAKGESRGAKP